MSLFFRPVVSVPVRCAPAFYARPAGPTLNDFAPLFAAFDDSFAQLEHAHRHARRHFKRPFNPRFNVKESPEAYSVEGELPGFDAKDLSIEFLDDGHTLQIKGKTVQETKQPEHQAVEAAQTQAVEGASEQSETGSVKSHQATVEDDPEEQPANSSAVAEQTQTSEGSAPSIAESSTHAKPETRDIITERYTGSFSRRFKFASKVDQEAVKASLKDGILAITLPFAKKPESRRIQIE